MNNHAWMVYCITRIDTRKPTSLLMRGPIVLSERHYSLAAALVRHGHREFYWEVAGPFGTRNEAIAQRRKMMSAWVDPHYWVEQCDELEPGVMTPTHPEVRDAFMAAAERRRAAHKDYTDAYRAKYVAPAPDPARARKTDAEKALTLQKQKQRRHQGKLLVRASKLHESYGDVKNDIILCII
jgi:hypothetical protein